MTAVVCCVLVLTRHVSQTQNNSFRVFGQKTVLPILILAKKNIQNILNGSLLERLNSYYMGLLFLWFESNINKNC